MPSLQERSGPSALNLMCFFKDETMTKEILRCPGCGGRSIVVDKHNYYDEGNDCYPTIASYGYVVECKKCGISGPRVESKDDKDKSKARETAIDKWNEFVQYSPKSKEKKPVIFHDDVLSPNEEPATEKQMKLAEWMSKELKIKIPLEKSKRNLMKFIGDNMDKFKKHQEQLKNRKNIIKNYSPYSWVNEDDDPLWGEEYF